MRRQKEPECLVTQFVPPTAPYRGMGRIPRCERGSISIFTVIISLAMLFAAGLAYDGSQKLGALGAARDTADNAARTCAQGVDEAALRGGASPALDPAAAASRAQAYLATTGGASGTAVIAGTECTVTVQVNAPTLFFPGAVVVTATETSDALFGIEAPL